MSFFFYSLTVENREALSTCVPAPSYHCMHPACNYGKAFHSRWELDRHVRAVHTGLKDFFCPFLGCVQGSLLTAFTRPDKLTSYIKTCHGHDLQVPLFCPAVGCSAPPSNLHDLAAHIREDHLVDTNPRKQRERCGDQVEILRATGNAARVKNGQE